MKTKLKLFAIAIFINFLSYNFLIAQNYTYKPFPTKDAIWSEWLYSYNDGLYKNINYTLFDKDTLINGLIYQKLFKVVDSIPTISNANLEGFLREEDKKVYYHSLFESDTDVWLLYDFNAEVGDTILIQYPIEGNIEIYKIDTIEMFNIKRKMFHILLEGMDFGIKWIEGIGSINGVLWPGTWPLNQKTGLLCLKIDNELVYYDDLFGTCFPNFDHLNVINEPFYQSVKIFPNPTNNNVKFEFADNVTGIIEIYSIDGRLILSNKIIENNRHEIFLEDIKKGIYFIKFIGTDFTNSFGQQLIKY